MEEEQLSSPAAGARLGAGRGPRRRRRERDRTPSAPGSGPEVTDAVELANVAMPDDADDDAPGESGWAGRGGRGRWAGHGAGAGHVAGAGHGRGFGDAPAVPAGYIGAHRRQPPVLPSRRRTARGAAALTLLLLGAAGVIVGGLVVAQHSVVQPRPGRPVLLVLAAVLLSLGTAASSERNARALLRRRGGVGRSGISAAGGSGGIGGAGRETRDERLVRDGTALLAFGVSAGLLAWSVSYVVTGLRRGSVDGIGPLTGLGALCLLTGVALLPRLAPQLWPRPGLPGAAMAGAGAVALVLLGTGGVVAAPGWVSDSQTSAPRAVAAEPDRVTGIAWIKTLPDVVEALPAGPGIVVATPEAISARDRLTGAVVWSYRRSGHAIANLLASPDGRRVFAVLRFNGAAGQTEVVGFDATTGRVLSTSPELGVAPRLLSDNVGLVKLQRTGTAAQGGQAGSTLTQYSARTGRPLWTFRGSRGCVLGRRVISEPALVAENGALIAEQLCPRAHRYRISGLDGRTGRPLWNTDTTTVPTDRPQLQVDPGAGDQVLAAAVYSRQSLLPGGLRYLDMRSGQRVLPGRELKVHLVNGFVVDGIASTIPYTLVDPRTGARRELDDTASVSLAAGSGLVRLPGATLTTSRRQGGAWQPLLVNLDPGPGGPVRALTASTRSLPPLNQDLDATPGAQQTVVAAPGGVYAMAVGGRADLLRQPLVKPPSARLIVSLR